MGHDSRRRQAPGPPRVAAVLVTYNRRDLLLESLAAVHSQRRAPDAVIVVDNASTDGSAAAVRARFPAVQLAELGENYGGAGGFAYGMALALADGADLIWIMDDDTVPSPGALLALLNRHTAAIRAGRRRSSPAGWSGPMAGAHPMNTPRAKPFASRAERDAAAAAGCIPIRSASFVSVLVDAAVCRRRGLPQADYFLWNDDFEFTTRLLRGNAGLLCPASVVVHKTSDVRLDRRRSRRPLLLRGPEQDLDTPDQVSRSARARSVRGRHAAALGPDLPELAATGARSGRRWPAASRPGSDRARARTSRCCPRPARPH